MTQFCLEHDRVFLVLHPIGCESHPARTQSESPIKNATRKESFPRKFWTKRVMDGLEG
jgi:hypothetical protein